MSNTKKIELRNCPFCGGKALRPEKSGVFYTIKCGLACGCFMHGCDGRENLITNWNRRAKNDH